QRRGGLAELDITKAYVLHGLDAARDLGHVLKEDERLIHSHIQHFVDILALISDFQGLLVVSLALAHVAGNIHVRQEVHLDLDEAVARAGLAAAALDVERKASWAVAAHLSVLSGGKQF